MPIDYSKWKNIEVSDDEDDTHPNIDTPSLFRWRHQARVERMSQAEHEKAELEKQRKQIEDKKNEIKQKLSKAEQAGSSDLQTLKTQDEELCKQAEEFKLKEEELLKKERLTPWNVDTISHDKFAKTIINKEEPKKRDEDLTEAERAERYRVFLEKNRSKIKHFGMLKHYEDSKQYLMENPDLVNDDTANYLVVWCIDLEIEEKHDLMEHVSHQCIVMQFILELAKTMKYDPRACVSPFFTKMQTANKEYKDGFYDELNAFKTRIRKRAQEKIEEAMKEAEEEERLKRLGPGGLDPVEVFETLPDVLKDCFESQNIELLQDALIKMDKPEAEYHMNRCIQSGLWVPDANKNKAAATVAEVDAEGAKEAAIDAEEVYEQVE